MSGRAPKINILQKWVNGGAGGRVMCETCTLLKNAPTECYGCPRAWRVVDGKTQYYSEPKGIANA